MINVRVWYVLDMDVEDVFDAMTDHENYDRYPGFERPSKMSHHCEEVTPLPLRHDRGDIIMEPV